MKEYKGCIVKLNGKPNANNHIFTQETEVLFEESVPLYSSPDYKGPEDIIGFIKPFNKEGDGYSAVITPVEGREEIESIIDIKDKGQYFSIGMAGFSKDDDVVFQQDGTALIKKIKYTHGCIHPARDLKNKDNLSSWKEVERKDN